MSKVNMLGRGVISRKGFEHDKLEPSRSQRTTAAETADSGTAEDGMMQSFWARMPVDILRDVLVRTEASGNTCSSRKNAVACAGVCRSWREIVTEILKSPQHSGKLTFPRSVKQPGPKDSVVQCYIQRDRSNHTYCLYLGIHQGSPENRKFLLVARKFKGLTCTDYIISSNPGDISHGSVSYMGMLRSNFRGTEFTIFEAKPPAKVTNMRHVYGNHRVAHISYESNSLFASRVPRRIQCVMDTITSRAVEAKVVASVQTKSEDSFLSLPFSRSKSTGVGNLRRPEARPAGGALVLRNKEPRWHEELRCWCLNFNGRATVASVKNFQLVASPENGVAAAAREDDVILQLGKVDKDCFIMDYQHPISAFQAFAICLSSFAANAGLFRSPFQRSSVYNLLCLICSLREYGLPESLLLEGANPKAVDKEGNTPLKLVSKLASNDNELLALLAATDR